MKKNKLGEICEKIGSGATPQGGEKNYIKNGFSFIRSKNVQDFYFNYENLAFINEEQAKKLSNVEIFPNDILFNITGDSIARCCLVPENILSARVSQHVSIIRCRENFNIQYIMYYLQYLKKYLLSICKIGGTRNALTKELLENLQINVLDSQNKIAAVLSSLDEKISLNKKINATLEDMAKTFFMHRFFHKSPNSTLGEIIFENPKSTIPVGEAKNFGGDFPFFTSGENILRWNNFLVDGRNIFLNTGGNAGIKFYIGKSSYSTDTWCITAKNFSDYLYLLLKTIEQEINKKFFQGTGLKHLQKDLLKNFALYTPTENEVAEFNKFVCPLFNKISKNFCENNLLENLRDFLLPMLMNGQVTFAEEA